MSDLLKHGWKDNFKYDAPAGLVVFLVALPLCLGIALASKAPLFSGIIAGIVGGIIISILSGSEISVSGPAAGLAVIVADSIARIGNFEGFLLAVVISGGFQLLMGTLRLGFIADYVPLSVIKGMLSGIGVIIFLKQIPHALGTDTDFEGDMSFFQVMDQKNTFTEILAAFYSYSPGAVVISVVSLVLLLLWDRPFMKKKSWVLFIPGPLVVVAAGILINEMFGFMQPSLKLLASDDHLVKLPVAESWSTFASFFIFPDFSGVGNPVIWQTALIIAVVGSLETLLSIEASDKIDPFRRISSTNRELQAQGVGNTVSGLLGGLPITSVIVRSSANVMSGARTRQSAFIHGLLLAVAVLILPNLMNRIPLASLAMILVLIGYKLAGIPLFKSMYRQGRENFLPFISTILVMVFTDLLTGVGAGLVVGIFFVMRTNHHRAVTVAKMEHYVLIRFNKDMTFVHKAELKKELRHLPEGVKLIVDGSKSMIIDRDIIEILEDFCKSAPYKNIEVEIRGIEDKNQTFVTGSK